MCRLILTAASAVPIEFCTTAPIITPKTTISATSAAPTDQYCKGRVNGNKPAKRMPMLFRPVPMA
ncbi:hypothetical protein Q5P01_009419 [Channa striata]|uniref:Uncharacterized protein n=1 Tax=Channa striata TaxID=64152 RepID=A0AA88N413_CHASR|nr:hypothetical protein Q5P01_009419 [Channa striata]